MQLPPSWCVSARAERPAGILAREGDLFYLKDHLFPYRTADGESLVLEAKDDLLLLNGKVVWIRLSEKGWDWLPRLL